MDADLIGLFALLVGLELILGVDNVLVIAILVSRLPESKRNSTRNFGLILALVARILMVFGGLHLMQPNRLFPLHPIGFSTLATILPYCRWVVPDLESSERNSCNC